MNSALVHRLIRGGEKGTVDFKITCNAFNRKTGDQGKAKAELVKDICAMANNGSASSYLIIGVGDDGKTYQSVMDPQLNDQNIQTLIRDAIHPRPNVRAHHVNLRRSQGESVQLVVIHIGAEDALMDGELAELDAQIPSAVIARLGVADLRAFGLTWEDCENTLHQLGYAVREEVALA